jgi:peptide/nickel transport system substrate-binding protein
MNRSARKRVLATVVVASLSALLAATPVVAGTNQEQASAASSKAASPLVVNIASTVTTLDPAEACTIYDDGVLGNFYARLTQYGTEAGPTGTTQVDPGKIIPYLAKSWTLSKDGLTYTFSLQKAVFPNGDPQNASAVKYSVERAIEMGGCGAYFVTDGISSPASLIKSIQAVNASTVVIVLSQPDPNFLQDLAQPDAGIVDPKVVEANGGVQPKQVNAWMASHVAGGGPFLLSNYSPNSGATLTANPTFFGKKPASSKILLNFITSEPTLLLDARSGQADITLGLSPSAVHTLKSNSCCRIVANDAAVSEQVRFPNYNNGPFSSEKFREALTYVVPYSAILQKVLYGYGSLFYGPFPPVMPEFNASLEKPRTFNLAKAKALIAASGVQTPVNVSIMVREDIPLDQEIATVLQSTWSEIGINATIDRVAPTTFVSRQHAHQYQVDVTQDGPGVIEAGFYLGYDLYCGSITYASSNSSGICIPGADALIQQGRRELSPVKKQAIWNKITKEWVATSPKIPVFAVQNLSVLSQKVSHYFYSHEWDFRTWAKK